MKEQPKYINIDHEVRLRKYYPYYKRTFIWYQDLQLCKQVDNLGKPYSMKRLIAMYKYLSSNGECYYIQYKRNKVFNIVGDVTLKNNGEISIVISAHFQNKHIGRRVCLAIIERAKELEYKDVYSEIYDFNTQSIKMFKSIGFVKTKQDKYIYKIK